MAHSEDARHWLRNNGYDDIADTIDRVLDKWVREKNHTRRNWWDILAGDSNGKPRNVAGIDFPVIRAAQKRQGRPITPNAISRNKKESVPEVWSTGRWSSAKSKS